MKDLLAFMQSQGLGVVYQRNSDGELIADGQIHRYSCRSNKPTDLAEWYIIHLLEDNNYVCTFGSWRLETKHTYCSKDNWKHDPKIIEELNKQQILYTATLENRKKEGIKTATELWGEAKPFQDHPYINKKQLNSFDHPELKVLQQDTSTTLLIPAYNLHGQVQSLQQIRSDQDFNTKIFKSNLAGTSTKGTFLILGTLQKGEFFYICEGYADAKTVHEATKCASVCCFGISACIPTALELQHKSEALPILACDNDEAGAKIIPEWKELLNNHVLIPSNTKDWNDFYIEHGLEETQKQLTIENFNAINAYTFLQAQLPKPKTINNLYWEASINIIYGTGGAGKSRFALELAYTLSINREFLGYVPDKRYKVLYIDGELNPAELQGRLRQTVTTYSNSLEEDSYFKIISNNHRILQGESDIDFHSEVIRKQLTTPFEEADIIFIDNYNSLTIPNDQDTHQSDVRQWLSLFKWLRTWKLLGKTIFLIMHSNKGRELQGVAQVQNLADSVLGLETTFDEDDEEVLLQAAVIFNKHRQLESYKQKPFLVRCVRDNQQGIGYSGVQWEKTNITKKPKKRAY